jgi:hypothetical protein
MKYRCHQCYGLVEHEDLAHVDLYFDLCWLQCTTCEAAFGPGCGMDRKHNPQPHGYLECPLRERLEALVYRAVPKIRVVI